MTTKERKYQEYIQYLRTLNLSYKEYDERVIAWCKKNNY